MAPGLKGIDDATLIRRRILLAFERAETAESEEDRRRLRTFAIVGGGPTGVEMAGALPRRSRGKRWLPISAASTILERRAHPFDRGRTAHALPALTERLSTYAERALIGMGVEVFTSSPVTRCDQRGVEIQGRLVEAGTMIWASGVAASPAAAWIDAPSDHAGRIVVEADLSVPRLPNVFVIGDAATVPFGPDKKVPGLAAAAKQMGCYVGGVIESRAQGHSDAKPFLYHHQGDLATIGCAGQRTSSICN